MIRSDDLDLAVESFGSGRALVFAHGLTGNRRGIVAQLRPLAERYRLVTFDQRGHGESSPVTDGALYEPRRMAEDITAVLDGLGIEQAIVGGESMGAATALLFALAHPGRVEALLLTAPAFSDQPNPDRARVHQMAQAISALGMPRFLELAASRQRDELHWSAAAIEHVRSTFASHESASITAALDAVADWLILPDLEGLSALRMPVCILAWRDDPLHPYTLAERLAAALPDAKLETLPSLPTIFEQPTLIGAAYESFLLRDSVSRSRVRS